MARFSELTVVYITANHISDYFAQNTINALMDAVGDYPIVSVSHKPMEMGTNICVGKTPRSQGQIYRQLLIGCKEAKSKYVAVAEDDVLYHYSHFNFRPQPGHWGYNMNAWSIFTWGEPMFTYKTPGGRRNLNGLICERDMLVEHLEQRFRIWSDDSKIDKRIFGEPGKYDNQLGTTPHPSEYFYTNPPNIVFSHQTALGFQELGTRKRVGDIRATEIPYWGTAEEIRRLYE